MKVSYISYGLLILWCLMMACKDEDLQDEEDPSISIMAPVADTRQWLEVKVVAEVSDNQQVSRVDFYLDRELLGEDTEAPYELRFDSRQYEDGTYTLRAVAYDAANNQSEVTREIEIFNKLLRVRVMSNYMENSQWAPDEAWIVVADTTGDVISAVMIEDNKTIDIARPEGMEDDVIHVLILRKWNINDSGESTIVENYQGISPTEWIFRGTDDRDSIGVATVHFTTSEEQRIGWSSYNVSTSRRNTVPQADGSAEHTLELDISGEPADAMVRVYSRSRDSVPTYAWLPNVRADSTYRLTADDFMPMSPYQTVMLPDNDRFNIGLDGISASGIHYNVFNVSQYDSLNQPSTVYIPEGLFDRFGYGLNFTSGSIGYWYSGYTKFKDRYEIPSVDFQVTSVKRTALNATTSYQASYSSHFWRYDEYSPERWQSVYWNVHTDVKKGRIQTTAVTLPAEVIDRFSFLKDHLDDLSYQSTSLTKQEGVSSLNDYISTYYQAVSRPQYQGDSEGVIIYTDRGNGRTARSRLPRALQEEMLRRGIIW